MNPALWFDVGTNKTENSSAKGEQVGYRIQRCMQHQKSANINMMKMEFRYNGRKLYNIFNFFLAANLTQWLNERFSPFMDLSIHLSVLAFF